MPPKRFWLAGCYCALRETQRLSVLHLRGQDNHSCVKRCGRAKTDALMRQPLISCLICPKTIFSSAKVSYRFYPSSFARAPAVAEARSPFAKAPGSYRGQTEIAICLFAKTDCISACGSLIAPSEKRCPLCCTLT
jgi:hypothetical protein